MIHLIAITNKVKAQLGNEEVEQKVTFKSSGTEMVVMPICKKWRATTWLGEE